MHDIVALQLATTRDAHRIACMSAALIERGLPPTWTVRRVSAHIRHRDSVVLVARSAADLLGFAIMQFGDTTAHLNLLAVEPNARRRGIARQLLTWLHESALVAGTFSIGLELRADNVEARRFYESMGYRQCGFMPRYYSNAEDAVRMSLDLTVRTVA